jgi:hypothetical protein
MSKFLTPPVWYNSAGVKSESLNNIEYNNSAVSNTSYGKSAQSGIDGSNVNGAISIGDRAISSYDYSISIGSYANNSVKRGAMTGGIGAISIGAGSYAVNNISIGYNSEAAAYGSMAIGYGANVKNVPGNENGIAIGYNVTSAGGGIGIGGSADANQIQLGDPNVFYDLKIGAGNGVVDGYIRGGLYVPTSEEGFNAVTYDSDIYIQVPINGGIYIIRVQSPNGGTLCSFLFEFNAYNTTYSLPFNYYNAKDDTMQAFIKAKPHDYLGKAVLEVVDSVSNTANILHNFEISVRLISQKYATG